MVAYKQDDKIFTFECSMCRSENFKRDKYMSKHKCFYTGYWNCSKCGEKFDYALDTFKSNKIQLSLFN